MASRINRVAVAAEAEMFKCMQTGKGVAIPTPPIGQAVATHQVCLLENHTWDMCADGPYIEDLDVSETRYMRNKTINSRTYVHMPLWLGFKDPARH